MGPDNPSKVHAFFQAKKKETVDKLSGTHGLTAAEVEAFIRQHGLLSFDHDFLTRAVRRAGYTNPLKVAADVAARDKAQGQAQGH